MSMSGGKGDTNYFGSFSYLKNDGILKSTNYQRQSGRVRVNQVINDWISASFGTYFSTSKSQDQPNGGYVAGVLPTILLRRSAILSSR